MIQDTSDNTTEVSDEAHEENFGSNKFENRYGISAFILAVVGGGVMLSVLICTVLGIVIRINLKRREKRDTEIQKRGRSSMRSGCGGFEDPPYLRMREPVKINHSQSMNR